MPRPRSAISLPLAVFAVAVALAVPSVDWLDGGNLVASAWDLGVAHPPGEVPWLVAVRLAQWMPVGDLAFRAALVSAASLAVLAGVGRALARRWGADDGIGATVLLLGTVLGPLALLQATRPEVYALEAALLATALWSIVGSAGPRRLAMGGLAFGMAALLHPLLALAVLPALVILAPWGRMGLGLAALAALGTAPLLAWLPLRAVARPELAWGVPDGLGPFLDVLLARGFASNFGSGGTDLLANSRVIGGFLLQSGAPWGAVLLWLGWRSGWRPPGGRRLLLGLLLWTVGNAATQWSQNKVYDTNPDAAGYLLVGTFPWLLLGAAALPSVWAATRSLRVLATLAIVLSTLLSTAQSSAVVRPGSFAAETWIHSLLAGTPPGSIVLLSGNDGAFLSAWARRVERWGPDQLVLSRVLLGHPHEERRLTTALAARSVPWSPALRDSPLVPLAGATAPVRIEIREPERGEAAAGSLRPAGLLWAAGGQEGPWLPVLRRRALQELESEAGRDPEASLVRAWWTSFHPGDP